MSLTGTSSNDSLNFVNVLSDILECYCHHIILSNRNRLMRYQHLRYFLDQVYIDDYKRIHNSILIVDSIVNLCDRPVSSSDKSNCIFKDISRYYRIPLRELFPEQWMELIDSMELIKKIFFHQGSNQFVSSKLLSNIGRQYDVILISMYAHQVMSSIRKPINDAINCGGVDKMFLSKNRNTKEKFLQLFFDYLKKQEKHHLDWFTFLTEHPQMMNLTQFQKYVENLLQKCYTIICPQFNPSNVFTHNYMSSLRENVLHVSLDISSQNKCSSTKNTSSSEINEEEEKIYFQKRKNIRKQIFSNENNYRREKNVKETIMSENLNYKSMEMSCNIERFCIDTVNDREKETHTLKHGALANMVRNRFSDSSYIADNIVGEKVPRDSNKSFKEPSPNVRQEVTALAFEFSDSDGVTSKYLRGNRRKKRKFFTKLESNAIKDGISLFGWGQWNLIKEHYHVLEDRSNTQIKDRARTMAYRVNKGDVYFVVTL